MGKRILIILVGLFVLLLIAGCGGSPADSPSTENVDTTTATATTPTTTATETSVETTSSTTTTTTTTTVIESKQNPWRKETVSVALRIQDDVDDPKRHKKYLKQAIEFWNGNSSKYTDHTVRFEYVSDSQQADFTIDVSPTVSQCGGEYTSESYVNCVDTFSKGELAGPVITAQMASRYDNERTKTYYLGIFGTMLGMEDTQDLPSVEHVDDPDLRDPWPRSNPVVVNISNQVNDSRNFAPLVGDAVEYWESGEGAEYANYSVDMELQPDAENADITVRFVSTLGECGNRPIDTGYIGCANRYSGDYRADEVSVIDIKGGYTDDSVRQTLIHEFGHIHGRLHGQQPLPEMNATFDAVHLPLPNWDERERPWLYDRLRVYTDLEAEPSEEVWRDEIYEALNYVEGGADGSVPEEISFEIVNNESRADIVIQAIDMKNDTAWISQPYGSNLDGDERIERISFHKISLNTRIDSRDVAYYTSRAIIYVWTEDYPEAVDEHANPSSSP